MLGASAARDAWDWPYLTKDGSGPQFFSLWIGILMMGLGALLIALQVAKAAGGKPAGKTRWEGSGTVTRQLGRPDDRRGAAQAGGV